MCWGKWHWPPPGQLHGHREWVPHVQLGDEC